MSSRDQLLHYYARDSHLTAPTTHDTLQRIQHNMFSRCRLHTVGDTVESRPLTVEKVEWVVVFAVGTAR